MTVLLLVVLVVLLTVLLLTKSRNISRICVEPCGVPD